MRGFDDDGLMKKDVAIFDRQKHIPWRFFRLGK